jgi:hypothetical protein
VVSNPFRHANYHFPKHCPLNTDCWLGLDPSSTSVKAVAVTPADATRVNPSRWR